MPQYKLTYLDFKGRAEPIRLIFAYTQTPFEDKRIQVGDFMSFIASMPFGTLPILDIDGKIIAQTHAICGYLGKQFGLSGANDLEEAECYMIAGGMEDMYWRLGRGYGAKPREEQRLIKELMVESLPQFAAQIEGMLQKNGTGFLVGNKLTWTDFFLFHGFDELLNMAPPELNKLHNYSHIMAFHKKIGNLPNVKEYIEKRPKTYV